MKGKWLKAKGSKYKHFYVGGRAMCDSPARPYSELDWHEHIRTSPKCPKCLNLAEVRFEAAGEPLAVAPEEVTE